MDFYSLPHEERFRVYDAVAAAECETYPGGAGPALAVAVARGKLGDVTERLRECGMTLNTLYTFPLGSAKPPERLRHDSRGVPASVWLVATFCPNRR